MKDRLIKPVVNLWDYGARTRERARANSINEICISLYVLSRGIKAKIRKGLAHIVLGVEELVSPVSVSGVPWIIAWDLTAPRPPKLCRCFAVIAVPEVPITDLLSLLRNQRTRTEHIAAISPLCTWRDLIQREFYIVAYFEHVCRTTHRKIHSANFGSKIGERLRKNYRLIGLGVYRNNIIQEFSPHLYYLSSSE